MNVNSKGVVIVGAVRTPIGAYKGSLKNLSADRLGSIVIKALLKKTQVSEKEIDDVIMGQVLTAGNGQNPARQASLEAELAMHPASHQENVITPCRQRRF